MITRAKLSSVVQGLPKYRSMLAGNSAFSPGVYESIATVSPSSATVSFTSIPSTYKHLQIRYMARTTDAATFYDVNLRFNSDTGNNYAFHFLRGNGTSPSVSGIASFSSVQANDVITGANSTSNIFGVGVIDIYDYTSTTNYKTVRWLSGNDQNGSGFVELSSGLWMSATAINRIDITQTFAAGTVFSLYGIKGS